jgi:hypothetical protein
MGGHLLPEWRSAQADRSKFFLDSRLWPLDCLYIHLPPPSGNINNLFLTPFTQAVEPMDR